jgi:hypothetical protein
MHLTEGGCRISMERKLKLCEVGNHMVPALYHSKTKSRLSCCSNHAPKSAIKRSPVKPPKNPPPKSKPRIAPIRKKSKKQISRDSKYMKIRNQFLSENEYCLGKINTDCTYLATEVHHGKGKIGELYFDTKFFIPLCPSCHRYIEVHPVEAKKLGFSFDRLTK